VGPRLDNEHRERGENAGDRGDGHRHVESREQLGTALLQDTAEQGDGEERPGARDRAVDARRGSGGPDRSPDWAYTEDFRAELLA
jgi:hypothetical protein